MVALQTAQMEEHRRPAYPVHSQESTLGNIGKVSGTIERGVNFSWSLRQELTSLGHLKEIR